MKMLIGMTSNYMQCYRKDSHSLQFRQINIRLYDTPLRVMSFFADNIFLESWKLVTEKFVRSNTAGTRDIGA